MSKKIAVITGASSGMGREFVLALDKQQDFDELWLIARRRDKLEALAAETRAPVRAISLDLGVQSEIDKYKALLETEQPDVRVLVNAAGFGKFKAFTDLSLEEQLAMIDLNDKALVSMTYLTLPYMTEGACIYQLGSLSSFQPVPYITTYGATKSFVLSYSRAMNRELKGCGIRVMAMNPGWVKTEFFNHAFQTNGDNEVQYFNYVYEADECVATGLKDLYKSKKDYSIHGLPVKLQVLGVKLLPHSIVMNIWLNQQKKPKNNTDLTTTKQ